MAFEEDDVIVTESAVKESSTIQEIRLVRDTSIPGAGLKIFVEKRIIKDGRMRTITGQVPDDKVQAGWETGTKTLKAHCLQIINNAEF